MISGKLHKVPEAAAELNIAVKTLWNWIALGRIPVVRLGRAVRISQASLDQLVLEGTQPGRRLA